MSVTAYVECFGHCHVDPKVVWNPCPSNDCLQWKVEADDVMVLFDLAQNQCWLHPALGLIQVLRLAKRSQDNHFRAAVTEVVFCGTAVSQSWLEEAEPAYLLAETGDSVRNHDAWVVSSVARHIEECLGCRCFGDGFVLFFCTKRIVSNCVNCWCQVWRHSHSHWVSSLSIVIVAKSRRLRFLLRLRRIAIDMAEDSPTSSCVVGSGSGRSLSPLPEPTPSPAAADGPELELETEMTIDVCKRFVSVMVEHCLSNERLLEGCAPQKCRAYTQQCFPICSAVIADEGCVCVCLCWGCLKVARCSRSCTRH